MPACRRPRALRPRRAGSRTSARSDARYSRSASRIAENSSDACSSAVRTAAPLPRFLSWKASRTLSGHSRLERASRVPSVEPSSTTTSSRVATGRSAARASSIAASTVKCSLKTGMRIVRPPAMLAEFDRPARRPTFRVSERLGRVRARPGEATIASWAVFPSACRPRPLRATSVSAVSGP